MILKNFSQHLDKYGKQLWKDYSKIILTDIDMLLKEEKRTRGGTYHSIYQYAKANNKYRKIMIKTKNRHIFNNGM